MKLWMSPGVFDYDLLMISGVKEPTEQFPFINSRTWNKMVKLSEAVVLGFPAILRRPKNRDARRFMRARLGRQNAAVPP